MGILALAHTVGSFTVWIWVTWAVILVNERKRTVAGSVARYRWSTLERAVRVPALTHIVVWPLSVIWRLVNMTEAPTGATVAGTVVSLLLVVWVAASMRQDYRDMKKLDEEDDDTWFSRMGKRLRRWARAAFGKRVLAPATMPR